MLKGQPELAEKHLDWLIAVFGKDRLFAEFIPHIVDSDYNNKTQQFEKNECTPFAPDGDLQKSYQLWLWAHAVLKRGLKPVVTLDAHFAKPESKSIQDAILMNGESGWHFARCFEGNSLVTMADGTLKEIKNIKVDDKVLTFNFEKNKIEASRILNVFKSESKIDEFGAYVTHGSGTKRIKKNILATKNHHIWSDEEWKTIDSCDSANMLYNGFDDSTIEVINGTLLGDGCITRTGRSGDVHYYSYGHAENQKVLTEIVSTLIGGKISVGHIDSGHRQSFFRTSSANSDFRKIYDTFYENGEKIVPEELNLTARMLAWWFMDDGSVCRSYNRSDHVHLKRKVPVEQYRLYCNNFHVKYVDILIQKLKLLGINATRFNSKNHSKGSDYGWYIIFAKSEGRKLTSLIKKFVPKELHYKLNQEEIQDLNYDDLEKYSKKELVKKIIKVELRKNNLTKHSFNNETGKTSKNNFSYKYDIEVENSHCYFVNNILVHNSHHILTPEEIYGNLTYLPGFNNLVYEKMIMNGLDFCSDVKYTKMDKSIKLAFESPSVKDSLHMIGKSINMDIVRKINANYHKDCCK